MTDAAEYGDANVKMPPLNEVEREALQAALAMAQNAYSSVGDNADPGSTSRERNYARAALCARIGRKIAFPADPAQW